MEIEQWEAELAKEPEDRKQKIGKLAGEVLALARDNILVSLRFLDVALLGLVWQERPSTGAVATDGSTVVRFRAYPAAVPPGSPAGEPQYAASVAALYLLS